VSAAALIEYAERVSYSNAAPVGAAVRVRVRVS
jgi:hypothetical protein